MKHILLGVPTLNGLKPDFFDSWNSAILNLIQSRNVISITKIITTVDSQERVVEEKREEIKFARGEGEEMKIYIHTVPRTQNHHARNLIMERAIEFDTDYCIMVDDDMVLNTDSFTHLIDVMDANKPIDVLALLAFKRGEPYTPVGYMFNKNSLEMINITKDTKGIVECDAVGFGCVIIKTELIERLNPPYCLVDDIYRGADIYFCNKAKQEANAKVFMDTSHEIGHLGFDRPIYRKEFLEYNR